VWRFKDSTEFTNSVKYMTSLLSTRKGNLSHTLLAAAPRTVDNCAWMQKMGTDVLMVSD
jgi:hypothetical protein